MTDPHTPVVTPPPAHDAGRIWFITGTSTGFGRALTEAALAAGDRVAATARKPEALDDLAALHGDRLHVGALDVTDAEQIRTAVADAIATFGRLDVVVNNAGYGLEGAAEELSDEQVRRELDTNLLGAIRVTRAVLPQMRAQRSGHVVQISSVGGQVAFPSLSLYHASKWGLEGFSEALAAETAPLGIRVTIVEPGGFRTNWAGASMDRATPMDAYAASAGRSREGRAARNGHQVGDPAKAAAAILEVVRGPKPPLRLALGNDAVDMIRSELTARLDELERWESLSRTTDFDHASSPPPLHA